MYDNTIRPLLGFHHLINQPLTIRYMHRYIIYNIKKNKKFVIIVVNPLNWNDTTMKTSQLAKCHIIFLSHFPLSQLPITHLTHLCLYCTSFPFSRISRLYAYLYEYLRHCLLFSLWMILLILTIIVFIINMAFYLLSFVWWVDLFNISQANFVWKY